jgi:hypothetical protein
MKRHLLFLCIPVTLLISACSKEEGAEQNQSNPAVDVAAESVSPELNKAPAATAADAAAPEENPGISIGAAPNVAFEYRYAFKLPDEKISAVQNEHADACETLGSARCQVTDMKFNKVEGERLEAALSFKLDPAIARKFGRDAIASVEKAEGILADGNVTGTNVGGEIEESQARSEMLKLQITRLEQRLTSKGLSNGERVNITKRINEMRGEMDNEQNVRGTGEAKLAMTPVQFTYMGNDGVAGFGRQNPFANAFDVAAGSFAVMFSFLLMALGFAGPWIALAALIIVLMRSRFANGIKNWLGSNKPIADKPTES